jgi:diguanylate cyclase (GGDEF)-like protein
MNLGQSAQAFTFSNFSQGPYAWALLSVALLLLLAALQLRGRAKADKETAFIAAHDLLTGLPNRKALELHLPRLLAHAHKRKFVGSVHIIDLDRFKDINDSASHSFGDEALRVFAARIKSVLRKQDFVARYGGDEFVVVQSGRTSIDDAAHAIWNLMTALRHPLDVGGKSLTLEATMGSALFPANGTTAEDLLSAADTALHAAKAKGRNQHALFEPAFKTKRQRRAEIEGLLRQNMAQGTFELHYQPLYTFEPAGTYRLKSFEALLRMQDGESQYVAPIEFIPLAEELGLIEEIGAWALAEACHQAKSWPEQINIAVNLSPVQFHHKTVVQAVEQALAQSGLAPQRLLLEVTESLFIADIDDVHEQLNALKALGIQLTMDDFGTGYSSLSYMLRFPFDRLKIDRSFIRALDGTDPKAQKIVQTIVALGQNMHMAVTAEGVETQAQADILRAMQCDDAQGYLYAKPLPLIDVAALILRDFKAGNDVANAAPFNMAAR